MTTATVSIASLNDAGYLEGGETWHTGGSSIVVGNDNQMGVRITGVAVPQGATVSSATLSTSLSGASGSSWGTLTGALTANAAAWSDPSNLPNNITVTDANVAFANAATQDVTTIVQELVNQASWASGNAMAFTTDTGGNGTINMAITVATTPTLAITYAGAGGGNFLAFF